MSRMFKNFLRYLKSLFVKINFSSLVEQGAQIIDVRTETEYQEMGAIKDSINIPLDDLRNQLSRIDRDRPVIICCGNGPRSGLAREILRNNGFKAVFRGGNFESLKRKLKANA